MPPSAILHWWTPLILGVGVSNFAPGGMGRPGHPSFYVLRVFSNSMKELVCSSQDARLDGSHCCPGKRM